MNAPDSHIAKTTSDWDIEATDVGVIPPIGLAYIAASILKHGKHDVRIVDNILERNTDDDIAAIVKEFNPDVVGIGTYTPALYDALELTELIKRLNSRIVTVWGGPHTMVFPNETMTHGVIDYLLLGEVEETFPRFCDALENGESFEAITGIVFRKDGEIIQTGPPAIIKDINSSPFPAFRLLQYKKYFNAVGTGKPIAVICSSRGCPYNCTFCCKPYSTYRSRSAENILAEIQSYVDAGIDELLFYDDLFNVNTKRVIEISNAIIQKNWKIRWAFRGRVDSITDEMLTIAKKAGCWQVFFGVEAGTDEGLSAINKRIRIQQVIDAVHLCRKHKIITSTNWIIGFPHDKNESDIDALIRTAIKVDSDLAQINICIIYHGTKIFEEAVTAGIIDKNIWADYVKRPVPDFIEPIWDMYMSRDELSGMMKDFYRRFYFRPKTILRRAASIRSIKELLLNIKGALVLLGVGGYKRGDKSNKSGTMHVDRHQGQT